MAASAKAAKGSTVQLGGVRYSHSTLTLYEPIRKLMSAKRYKERLTEVSINGPGNVFVWVAGRGYERVPAREIEFVTARYIRDLCGTMAANLSLDFSETTMPSLACRTPDGCRFQADVGKFISSGFAVSIRIPRKHNATFDDFEVSDAARDQIIQTVQEGKCIILSGSTNAGKTTFLNLLVGYIPAHHRVISIEDVPEIDRSRHPNGFGWVLARHGGGSSVSWTMAIDDSLRHNPHTILPGELSIKNAFPILQAMDTGHESVITTMHANSPMDALRGFRRRVGLAGGPATELESIMEFLAETVGMVIQLKHVSGADNVERRVVTDAVVPRELLADKETRAAFARADNDPDAVLSPEERTLMGAGSGSDGTASLETGRHI